MQKLLVASQSSGVGKTTSSINLAAATAMAGAKVLLVEADAMGTVDQYLALAKHPNRQALKDLGIEMPGNLCTEVIPNLDVISPYSEAGCCNEDLDQVLHMLATRGIQEGYDCLIVNAPPFLDNRPASFLRACDSFLIVMQAEVTAHRTMPAFLSMIQQAADAENLPIRMRGVLITLPETEAPGGRFEREIRGRFGGRALPQPIPFDEEIPRSQLFGQIVTHSSEVSLAAQAYREAMSILKLNEGARAGSRRSTQQALSLAAASVRGQGDATSEVGLGELSGSEGSLSQTGPLSSRMPNRAPGSNVRPGYQSSGSFPAQAPTAPQDSRPNRLSQVYAMLAVVVAVAVGVGLRFLDAPKSIVPIGVGLVVTAGTVLLMKYLANARKLQQQIATAGPTGGSGSHRIPPQLRQRR